MDACARQAKTGKHIVVGVDFSAPSIDVARWTAQHIADAVDLVLAHAIPVHEPPSFLRGLLPSTEPAIENARRGAEQRLRALAASLGVRVWPEIHVGRPDEVLLDVTKRYAAELLVIGPHGDRPGLGQFLGSTAERMAREAPSSVLLARALRADGLRTVLVALEESAINDRVLHWVERLARSSKAEVRALHVVNPVSAGGPLLSADAGERHDAEARVRDRSEQWLREELAKHGARAHATEITFGDARFEILAAADRHAADLVVVGRSAPRSGRSKDLGGTAAFIMRNGRGSVLLVAAS